MALTTLLAATIALVAPTPTLHQDAVTLRMNPPEGTFRYEIRNEMQQEMMGQNLGFTSTAVARIELSKVDGGFRMVMSMSEIRLDIPAGSPMEAGRDQMLQAMQAGKTTMVFDERGTVKSVSMEGLPEGMSAPGASSFSAMAFPKDPVRVGDTWTQTLDMKAFMPGVTGSKTTVPISHQLTKLENGQATIVSTTKGDVEMEMQGQTVTMNMTSTSTMVVEVATGMVVTATSEGTNNLNVMGMTIPQKIKSTMKRLP